MVTTKELIRDATEEEIEAFLSLPDYDYTEELENAKKLASQENSNTISALSLFKADIQELPKLVNPFFQTAGLASLVGSSDTGKSTFLRQLALSIALKKESFLGFQLNCKSKFFT